jgi:serine/threonine protein kinase
LNPQLAPATSILPAAGTENSLAIGTRLHDFEIIGVLGEGGFGIVYQAFDHSLQRTVAIKEYMPVALAGRTADGNVAVRAERHQATFEAGLKSFINEARLLAQFDHPALIKVYRFWEQNRTAYMVMRHYQGQTMGDIIKHRPDLITEAWLKFTFKPVLEALDTLFKTRILHRDVSPDNIIVQKSGEAVLLDFGSARQIIGDMTHGLTVILKPGYAPIEQYSNDSEVQQGPWTDIYALSAVMYFAIKKTPPPISIARIVKDTLQPLHPDQLPGFSAKFLAAVNQGLAMQPQGRPQSMEEFRRLLGISAFVSARNLRTASVIHGGEIAAASSQGEDIAKLTMAINAPRTAPPPAPDAPESRGEDAGGGAGTHAVAGAGTGTAGGKFHPGKYFTPAVLGTSLGMLVLIGLALALVLRSGKPAPGPLPAQPATASHPVKAGSAVATTALPAGMVNLKVLIKPWGTVFVDGIQMGASPPLKSLSLSGGKHKIRVTNPGFPDFVTEVEVGKHALPPISHEFTNQPQANKQAK